MSWVTPKPKLLDLFCGPGGATKGYQRAGFYVIGVDAKPQSNYCGDEFYQADAMTFDMTGFAAIHASPPCQHYSLATYWRGDIQNHPDMLMPVVDRLKTSYLPWVVENVPHSPMEPDFVLCGSMFGLKVRRHRWFLTSWSGFDLVPSCHHQSTDLPFMHKNERAFADAMECTWMTKLEAREAIPPAYTTYLGNKLMDQLT